MHQLMIQTCGMACLFFGGHINITCFQLGIFSGGSVVSDGDNDLEVGGCQVWIR
jgi:hypothetical protein